MADPRLRVVIEALNKASGNVDEATASVEALAEQTDALTDAQGRASDSNAGLQAEVKATGAATEDAGRANDEAKISFTELNSAIGVAKQAYEALQKVYGATVGETLELASAQRELALAGQISVEEAGQLIQIADDLKISSDQLKTAFKAMKNEGLQPSIATIKDVAAAYQSAKTPIDKLNIAQAGLGRSYQDLLPLLELTPEKIDEMARAASDAGLVMSTEAVEAAREYELAMDSLGDAWQAFVVTIGTGAIPVLTEALTSMNDQRDAMRALKIAMDEGAITQEEWVKLTHDLKFNTEEAAVALQLLNEKISENRGFTGEATGGLTTYEIAAQRAAFQSGLLAVEAGKVNDALADQKSKFETTVYGEAEAALRKFNIPLGKRVELEEAIALATGKVTEADLKRQDQIDYLTKQLELGRITQDEWLTGIENLAGGAADSGVKIEDAAAKFVATGDAIEDEFLASVKKADTALSNTLPDAFVVTTKATQEYGALLEKQQEPGGPFYRYIVGFDQITGAAKRAGDAIRGVPPLSPGGFFVGGGGTPGIGTPAQNNNNNNGYVIGAADGLHMTVPPGYPNDSFGPIYAQSGETIDINKPGEKGGGLFAGATIIVQSETDIELLAERVTAYQSGRL